MKAKKVPLQWRAWSQFVKKRRKLTWEDYFEYISKSDWWGGSRSSETVSHSNINGHKHRQSPKMLNHAVSGLNFLTRSKIPHSLFATKKKKSERASLKPAGWRSVTSPTRNQAVCVKSPSIFFSLLLPKWVRLNIRRVRPVLSGRSFNNKKKYKNADFAAASIICAPLEKRSCKAKWPSDCKLRPSWFCVNTRLLKINRNR